MKNMYSFLRSNLSASSALPLLKTLTLTAFLLLGTSGMWGADVIYPSGGTTLNTNWQVSASRVARQTVNSQVVLQLQAVNNDNYGELSSVGTFTNITGISVNATSNKNKSATLKLLYSSDNSTWTEVSTETISGDGSQTYNDYSLTLTGLPSTAVYVKFQNSGSSNSVYIYSVTITTSGGGDPVAVTGVTLDEDDIELTVGGIQTLTATVAPSNATNKAVTWSSDDEDVATVSSAGLVTAVGVGTATITVTTTDGSKTATCGVTVSAVTTYTVTWMTNGESYTTTSVVGGQKPTFPATNPTSCDEDEDGSKTFYGWATAEWTGKIDADGLAGKTVYTQASDMPAVSGPITYYAVFCKAGATFKLSYTTSGTTYYAGTKGSGSYLAAESLLADAAEFGFETATDGYYVYYIDNGTKTYIGGTGANTTLNTTATPGSGYIWTYTESSGELSIKIGSRYLGLNTSTKDRFSTYTTGYPLTKHAAAMSNYMTNCTVCNENVTISKGAEENGTFDVTPIGKRAACDQAVVVTVTPHPATGYRIATSNPVTVSGGSPTITNNNDGTWTVTYAQHTNASSTINVAFEQIPGRTYTFNAGSGTCLTASLTESLYGSGVNLPVATAPSGCDPEFTFAGWATASVSETTTRPSLYSANTTYAEDDLALYAVYKQSSGSTGFTLSIDVNGTTYYAAERTGTNKYMGASTDAADAVSFDIVEKDNKQYLCWINGATTQYISSTASGADLSFTTSINDASEWNVSDGGSTIELQSAANSRYFTINSSTKDRFAGYASSNAHTLTKSGEASAATYNSNPACVCTSVSITYDANGGTLAAGCSNVTDGGCDLDWQLCSAPTRSGYVFVGWKDQKGTIHEAEEEVLALHGSLTLTAQWLENPYTVYFNAGNGSCSKTSLTETARGDGVKLPTATPVGQCSDEWHFVGWTKNQLSGDENTSYDVAGVANQTYVPETNNETLYAVYSKVDISGDGDVVFSRYTESSIQEGLYVLVMYQLADSYGRLKYGTLNGGRVPYTNEYTTSPASITINSPSLSDYVFQLTNVDGKWMLYNLGNEVYLGAGSSGNLTWSARTPSLTYTAEKESSTSDWWRFNYDTYYLGANKGSDYIRNYASGTLTNTYCIALYKGAAGTTYYSCSPVCESCTEPGWRFRDGENVVKTIGSPNYTNIVDKEYASTGSVIYKSSNEDVAVVNESTGEVTLKGKGSTVITLKLAKSSTYCAQVLQYELEVKDPAIEVVEVTKTTDQNNPSDPNEYYGLVVEHDLEGSSQVVIKERETTLVGEYANDLFISKYFEAASNMKLFAIFNGTDHDIDFTDIRVRCNCSLAGLGVWPTQKGDLGYVELKDVSSLCNSYPELKIPKGTELIFWSNNTTSAAAGNTTLRGCINMTIDGKAYTYTDMKNDNIPNWFCLGDKTTYNTLDADGNNQFVFNGDDSMILERYNSETGQWEAIDVLGAGTSSAPYSVASLKAADEMRKVTTKYTINNTTQELNDDYGFYAKCEGITIPYSTNRYMLIRKKDVKDGTHAVASNKTSFATLCEEWNGTPVGGESSAYCYSGQCFAEVAQYDFAKEYVDYVDLPAETLSSFDNGDGTQTIIIKDMTDRACNTLLVSVKDENDKIVADDEFKIPIIVDANVSTDNDLFYLKHDACATCDVIVMQNATLTKAADDETKDMDIIRNLDVYAGGKVVVPAGTNYTINNLTLRSRVASDGLNLDAPEMVINGNLKHKAKSITQRLRLDANRFYNFVVPYSVRKTNIIFSNGSQAVYGEDYIIDVYDGQKRAENQTEGNWVPFDGEILHPGVGYTMAVAPKAGHAYADLVLPMPDGDLSAGEPDTKALYIYAWGTSETRANHKGWNLIGNPYLQIYGKDNIYTDAESMLTVGKLIPDTENPGWWKNDGGSIPYVTVINNTRNDYTQELVSAQELSPFATFFVQVGKPATATGTKVNLTFDKSNRKVNAAPRFMTNEEVPSITRVGFYIKGTNNKDNFGIVVGKQYTPAYEMQADLSKEFGSIYSLKGYTLQDGDNLPLAYNAVNPDRLAQPIPVGVRLPASDTYTFSLDKRYDLSAFEHIWLNDNVTAKYVDLLVEGEDYKFEGDKSQIENRFSITLVLRPKNPTSIDNFVSGILISGAQGVLRLTGLPENASVYIYDMAGHMVETSSLTNQATAIYHVPAGVYQVRVVADGNNALLRTIVY